MRNSLRAYLDAEASVLLVDPDNIRSQRAVEKIGDGHADGTLASGMSLRNSSRTGHS